ncbi:MAG: AMP-binding protein [Oscillospiraceae bacterium]|nr:AMP-binding protein [Oscillospiraceae bacterium]
MKSKNYPLYKVDPLGSIRDLVDNCAVKYGDSPAFTFERDKERVSISYRQFRADTEALGTALHDLGLKNSKIALIGENSYEWIVSYIAAVNGGNVIVPLDKELSPAEIANLLRDCQADAIIHSDNYKSLVDGLPKQELNIRHKISMKDQIPALIARGKELVKTGSPYTDYAIDNTALSTIIYTSGTTGVSKGVMLSHKSISSDVVVSCRNCTFSGVSLLVLPLHHSFAFTGGILIMMNWGCNIVINRGLKEVAGDLVKYKPSNTLLVPLFVETFYKKVWDSAKKSGKDGMLKKLVGLSNLFLKLGIDLRPKLFKKVLEAFGGELDVVITGGAPIDSAYIKGFRDFGLKVLNGYGISECSPVVSVNRNHYYRDGSIGLVLPEIEVKILDPDQNGHGEICVKGDIVMLGYYQNEQATKDAFDDGWFKTGDIGYLDSDNFLFISGRKKNVIILGNGKNVYPEELEFALSSNIPYIKESVVYAEGDDIAAEIFLDTENHPDCAALLDDDIKKLNQTMPVSKHIRKTKIRDTEFPKTTTKKIKRW